MQVLTPYIAEGLLRGERCFCAQKPEILKRLVYDLLFLGIDTDRVIKRGALELHSEDETYFSNGQFEPRLMMDMLIRSIRESEEQGFTSFRSAGELSWAARQRNDCDKVIGYEKMVEEYYPGKPAIGLCQYSMNDFAPDVLEAVVDSHRQHMDVANEDSSYSSLNFQHERCHAEVVADKLVVNPRYYYVVQQKQPKEIIGWGVSRSFDAATSKIHELVGQSRAGA